MNPLFSITAEERDVLRAMIRKIQAMPDSTLNRPSANPADHEEFPAASTFIALSPIGGIPAMTPPDVGTGPVTHYRPGVGNCQIYSVVENDQGIAELLEVDDLQEDIYNVAMVPVNGLQFFTPVRDRFGSWLVPWPGLLFTECTTTEPGTGTGTGTGTGISSNCFTGKTCDSPGVAPTLTATITDKMGCYATAPDNLFFSCQTAGADHNYIVTPAPGTCGEAQWLLEWGIHGPVLTALGFTEAEPGWTCSPFSAVFHLGGSGNSCTVTITG